MGSEANEIWAAMLGMMADLFETVPFLTVVVAIGLVTVVGSLIYNAVTRRL